MPTSAFRRMGEKNNPDDSDAALVASSGNGTMGRLAPCSKTSLTSLRQCLLLLDGNVALVDF
jgi:hypothetical protein